MYSVEQRVLICNMSAKYIRRGKNISRSSYQVSYANSAMQKNITVYKTVENESQVQCCTEVKYINLHISLVISGKNINNQNNRCWRYEKPHANL